MWDADTWALNKRNTSTQAWKERWQRRRDRAFAGGAIDHTKEPDAPHGTLARYGYLVPLEGEALEAYKEWRAGSGRIGAPGDRERYAWEDRYIAEHVVQQKNEKTA